MPTLENIGLVLLGHGSTSDPSTALPIWECAERVRPRFRDVRVAFWKEQPQPHEVIESVHAHDVVVVPFLMSDGWFSRTAFPRALGLPEGADEAVRERGARRFVYTRPIGVAEGWLDVALAASEEGRAHFGASTLVVVVAHGTPRDLRSTESAQALAKALNERGVAACARFIEDGVPGALGPDDPLPDGAVVVPYFVGEGPHVTDDLRQLLGLAPGTPCGLHEVCGARILLTPALGSSPAIDAVVTRIAQCAAGRMGANGSAEPTPVQRALELLEHDLESGAVALGAVEVARVDGGYVLQPVGARGPVIERPLTAAHRWARFDDEGRFRPWLSAWSDRPTGWCVRAATLNELRDVLEVVAPGALALRSAGAGNEHWSAAAKRSSGRRRHAAALSPNEVVRLADRVCGPCARLPSWRPEPKGVAVGDMRERGFRCPTPCGRVLDAGAARVAERDEASG